MHVNLNLDKDEGLTPNSLEEISNKLIYSTFCGQLC